MGKQRVMKDVGLNEPISITLPAHVWVGFIGAYGSTKWECPDASTIASEVVDQLFDPVYVKEREAAMQQHRDVHESHMIRLITGRSPEVPPHMEEGGI